MPYLFDAVPDIRKEKNSYKTMKDIATGFHLTAAEVKWIEDHFHKYTFEDVEIIEPCVRSTNETRKKKK